MSPEPENNDKMLAATEFIKRTGAAQVQFRYSDIGGLHYKIIGLGTAG